MTIQLTAHQLTCARQQKIIFTDLSFALQAGEALLVEGPNGAGKSSLLRMLTGIATPLAGEIKWCDQSIQHDPTYHEHLHYIGHSNGIKLGLTVAENLQLAQCLSQMTHTDVASVLTSLQLQKYIDTPAHSLSAGQKRRIALAKLFLFPKAVWILDEPLTALDVQTQTLFLAQLESHLENNGIAIISSHQPIVLKNKMQTLRLGAC